MFNPFRKKPGAPDNTVEIPGYAPYSGITPKDYVVPLSFRIFETRVEERIRTFLAKAHPDEYNGDFLDRVINAVEEEGLADLLAQKATHESCIRSLGAQFGGDLIKCDRRIETLQEKIKASEAELQEFNRIYQKYNQPKAAESERSAVLCSEQNAAKAVGFRL